MPTPPSPRPAAPALLLACAAVLLCANCVAALSATGAQSPGALRKGYITAEFQSNVLGNASTLAGMKEMVGIGATWVAVEPLLTQASLNSSEVRLSEESTTDAAFEVFLQAASQLNLVRRASLRRL